MASFTDWLGGVNLGSLGQGLLGGIGYTNLMSDLQQTGRDAQAGAQAIGEQAVTSTAFKPYTVTTASGGRAGYDEAGNVFQQLGGQEAAIQNQLLGQAGNMYSQAMQTNPYLQQQASMFGGMSQNYAPTPFIAQGLSSYDPSNFQAFDMGDAQAGQFGGQAYSLGGNMYNTGSLNVGQAGQFGQQAGMYGPTGSAASLGGANFRTIGDTVSAYGFRNAGVNTLGQQAMSMGAQQLGQAGQAPGDLQALRGTAASQAQGMLGGLGQSQAGREADVYNRIRAMQTPEEQRQQLALEERLAAQGRLGVSTAQFGGTPEQMALDKARAEAQNTAAVQAMQQAGTEADRAYQQATGLAGLTGNLAGQSSQLQSQAQQRATELANLGMTSQQINSQLQSEGLSRALQAGQYNREGVLLTDQLQQSDFQRRLAAGEFGLRGQEVASSLASAQQQRDLSSMGFNRENVAFNSQMQNEALQRALQSGQYGREGMLLGSQLASQQQARDLEAMGFNRETMGFNDQLQNSAFQRALQSGQFGREGQLLAANLANQSLQRDISAGGFLNQQQQLGQQFRTQDIQNQLALAGGSQQALAQQLGLQTGYGQLGQGMLSGAYVPQSALLNAMQQGTAVQELADLARRQGGQLQAEAGMAGLDALLQSQLGAANLGGQGLAALAAMLGNSSVSSNGTTVTGGLTLGDVSGMLSDGWDWLTNFGENAYIANKYGTDIGSEQTNMLQAQEAGF